LNAFAPENIPVISVRLDVFQFDISALNTVAPENIFDIFSTLDTSQLDPFARIYPLNFIAPKNIFDISVTLAVFHSDRFPLNAIAPENILDIFVILLGIVDGISSNVEQPSNAFDKLVIPVSIFVHDTKYGAEVLPRLVNPFTFGPEILTVNEVGKNVYLYVNGLVESGGCSSVIGMPLLYHVTINPSVIFKSLDKLVIGNVISKKLFNVYFEKL